LKHSIIQATMRPAPDQQRIEHFERTCRARRLPVTIQRRTVFEAIVDRHDHPTADQIYAQIRGRLPGISRATVYRILDTFVELGLITRICHLGSAARFDPKIHQHHHLVCMECERIIDVEDARMDRVPWPDVGACGFEIRDCHVHFRGLCADCRGTRKAKAASARPMGRRNDRRGTGQAQARPRRQRRTKP